MKIVNEYTCANCLPISNLKYRFNPDLKINSLHIVLNSGIALIFASCTQSSTTNDAKQKFNAPELPEHVLINDCIKQAIYFEYKNQNYDSVDTKYFQLLEDYSNEDAIELSTLLKYYNKQLPTLSDSTELKNIIYKCDSIKQELSRYSKELVGYVFVHSFQINKKLNSAIFLIDKACRWSEMIPVKAISKFDSEDFVETFRTKKISDI
ncbi:MAG: hypothetical protein ACK4K0_02715 [Flavobacteriales bacterium]